MTNERRIWSSLSAALVGASLLASCDGSRGTRAVPESSAPALSAAGSSSEHALTGAPVASELTGSAPATAARSAGAAASSTATASICAARRVFTGLGSAERVPWPASFSAWTVCDALHAVFPDYDEGSESSVQARGTVRADSAFELASGDRTLLVLSWVAGKSAEEDFLCGCCTANVNLAVLETSAGKLALVARGAAPIEVGGLNSRLALASAPLPHGDGEDLLTLDAHHSCGTAPGRSFVHGLRIDGKQLREVLGWRREAQGADAKANRMEERSSITSTKAKDGTFEHVFSWSRASCPFDDQAGDFVCGKETPVGTETLRWDGSKYRLTGPRVKLEFL